MANGAATPGPATATATVAGLGPAPPPAGHRDGPALLELREVARRYSLPREALWRPAPVVHALAGVSLELRAGRNLGVVGESGSGKSTLARVAMALEPPSAGQVLFLGRDLNRLPTGELREARRDFQMVFQDPYGSLDPRQRVGRIVAEPLFDASASAREERVSAMLDAVGLRAADADKYPHEFSGGQRQRIAIARALITRPKLIVADEPVSALDVSVQAQVLNLLQDLQDHFGVTYLLISHDLAVVDHVCDEVLVMYAGRVVEQGPSETLFRAAAHPYTRELLKASEQTRVGTVPAAAPAIAPARQAPPAAAHTPSLPGGAAHPGAHGVGPADIGANACAFAARCRYRQGRCHAEAPPLRAVAGGHFAACHFAEQFMIESPPLA
jgi:peptide/nickel transport system ATP-binding protein